MADVIWSPSALDDIDAIEAFIAKDSPAIASAYAGHLIAATDDLADHPGMGRIVPEVGDPGLREIIVAPYRIMYRIDQERVLIVAVVHGARDWREP